jgi:superfamily II DNA helicase RecQ
VVQRSNLRSDVRIIFRIAKSGISGTQFPELGWILSCNNNSLIFVPTVHMAFRVHAYLIEQATEIPGRHECICLYNSANFADHNNKTLDYLCNKSSTTTRIIVSTAALTNGVDPPNMGCVVVFPQPATSDELLQNFGWANRKRDFRDAQGIVYVSKDAVQKAKRIVTRGNTTETTKETRQISMAQLILSQCKVNEINTLYDNPPFDMSCTRATCLTTPPPPSRAQDCNCSGCQPEESEETVAPADGSTVKKKQKEEKDGCLTLVTKKSGHGRIGSVARKGRIGQYGRA